MQKAGSPAASATDLSRKKRKLASASEGESEKRKAKKAKISNGDSTPISEQPTHTEDDVQAETQQQPDELNASSPSTDSTKPLTLSEFLRLINANKDGQVLQGLQQFQRQLHVEHSRKGKQPQKVGSEAPTNTLLLAYLKSSPECHELFGIWDEHFKKNRDARLCQCVVEVLADILRYNVFPVTQTVNAAISRLVLRGRMRLVYGMLGSDSTLTVIAALRLLTALVLRGPLTAHELFANFDFSYKPIATFADRRYRGGNGSANSRAAARRTFEMDIRTHYMRFCLAFVRVGDTRLVEEVIKKREMLGALFKSLPDDVYPVVSEFLTTLFKGVLCRSDLSRTLKATLFTPYALSQLGNLYIRSESHERQRQLVEEFVVELCCSPDRGIRFSDPGWCVWGTDPKALQAPTDTANVSTTSTAVQPQPQQQQQRNKSILRFLANLSPHEYLSHRRIVLTILGAHPGLVLPYLQTNSLSYEPRLSFRWFANTSFLLRLMIQSDLPPPFSMATADTHATADIESYEAELEPPNDADFLLDCVLPPALSRTYLSQGLQNTSLLVRYQTVLLMLAAFRKVDVIATRLSAKPANGDARWMVSTSSRWARFSQTFRDGLQLRLPDIQLVIGLLRSLGLAEKGKGEHDVIAASSGDEENATGVDTVATSKPLVRERALKLLGCYQRHLSEHFAESRFDVGRLIPPDIAGEMPPSVQLQLLKILMDAPTFQWAAGWKGDTRTRLGALLTLLAKLSADNSQQKLLTLVREVVTRIMMHSDVFFGNHREIAIWLEHIIAIPAAIPFIERVVSTTYKAPHQHADLIAAAMSTARSSSTVVLQAAEDVGKPPFSAVLSGALHQYAFLCQKRKAASADDDSFAAASRFVVAVLWDILHRTADPVAMCRLATHYFVGLDGHHHPLMTTSMSANAVVDDKITSFLRYAHKTQTLSSSPEAVIKAKGTMRPLGVDVDTLVQNVVGLSAEEFAAMLPTLLSFCRRNTPGAVKPISAFLSCHVDISILQFAPFAAWLKTDMSTAADPDVDHCLKALPYEQLLSSAVQSRALHIGPLLSTIRAAVQRLPLTRIEAACQTTLYHCAAVVRTPTHSYARQMLATLLQLLEAIAGHAAKSGAELSMAIRQRILVHPYLASLFLQEANPLSTVATTALADHLYAQLTAYDTTSHQIAPECRAFIERMQAVGFQGNSSLLRRFYRFLPTDGLRAMIITLLGQAASAMSPPSTVELLVEVLSTVDVFTEDTTDHPLLKVLRLSILKNDNETAETHTCRFELVLSIEEFKHLIAINSDRWPALDRMVLHLLLGSIPGNGGIMGPSSVAYPDYAQAVDSAYVQYRLRHLTPLRVAILALLVVASDYHRDTFVDYFLSKRLIPSEAEDDEQILPFASIESAVADDQTVLLLPIVHAFLFRLRAQVAAMPFPQQRTLLLSTARPVIRSFLEHYKRLLVSCLLLDASTPAPYKKKMKAKKVSMVATPADRLRSGYSANFAIIEQFAMPLLRLVDALIPEQFLTDNELQLIVRQTLGGLTDDELEGASADPPADHVVWATPHVAELSHWIAVENVLSALAAEETDSDGEGFRLKSDSDSEAGHGKHDGDSEDSAESANEMQPDDETDLMAVDNGDSHADDETHTAGTNGQLRDDESDQSGDSANESSVKSPTDATTKRRLVVPSLVSRWLEVAMATLTHLWRPGNGDTKNTAMQVQELFSKALYALNAQHARATVENNVVLRFAKAALRWHFGNAAVLRLLWQLLLVTCDRTEATASDTENLLTSIYDLVVNHSQFMATMVTAGDVDTTTSLAGSTKHQIVQLLLLLYTLAPKSLCRREIGWQDNFTENAAAPHVSQGLLAVLLASYTATLHPTDRLLLQILYRHEAEGVMMSTYGFLWGESARSIVLPALQTSGATPLVGGLDITLGQLLEGRLLNADKLLATVDNYPFAAHIPAFSTDEVFEVLERAVSPDVDIPTTSFLQSQWALYDPAFVVLFLHHILVHATAIDCRKFIDLRALSFLLCGLAAEDDVIRKLAYQAMARFSAQLDMAVSDRFREKTQVQLLLRYLKNGITQPFQRLPALVAVFAHHSLAVMVRSAHFLYRALNKAILRNPFMEIDHAPPQLFALFHGSGTVDTVSTGTAEFILGAGTSTSVGAQKERSWVLRMVSRAIQRMDDYRRLHGGAFIKLLMSQFESPALLGHDLGARKNILEILTKCVSVPPIAQHLTQRAGLFAWLRGVCSNPLLPRHLLYSTVGIITALFDALPTRSMSYVYEEFLLLAHTLVTRLPLPAAALAGADGVSTAAEEFSKLLQPVLRLCAVLARHPMLQSTRSVRWDMPPRTVMNCLIGPWRALRERMAGTAADQSEHSTWTADDREAVKLILVAIVSNHHVPLSIREESTATDEVEQLGRLIDWGLWTLQRRDIVSELVGATEPPQKPQHGHIGRSMSTPSFRALGFPLTFFGWVATMATASAPLCAQLARSPSVLQRIASFYSIAALAPPLAVDNVVPLQPLNTVLLLVTCYWLRAMRGGGAHDGEGNFVAMATQRHAHFRQALHGALPALLRYLPHPARILRHSESGSDGAEADFELAANQLVAPLVRSLVACGSCSPAAFVTTLTREAYWRQCLDGEDRERLLRPVDGVEFVTFSREGVPLIAVPPWMNAAVLSQQALRRMGKSSCMVNVARISGG